MSSTSLLPINGGHLLFTQGSSFPNYHPSATLYKWGWKRQQGGNVVAYRANGHALQILANPNRKRQIEAINGAWAMIGLTAGLVIEAQTGKGILDQLVGYWNAIVNIFMPQ